MRRREFSAALAGLVVFARQAHAEDKVRRIGVLVSVLTPELMGEWLEGLHQRGYVVGKNLQIEYRFTAGRSEGLTSLAAELAALAPELIVAAAPGPAQAVRTVAPNIPLVFVNVADPVMIGLVESLAHPGGNATGIATIVPEGFQGKSYQLLKELVPHATRIAALYNPANPMHRRHYESEGSEIARQLGFELIFVEATVPDQFETAFEHASNQGAEAINVLRDALTYANSEKMVALAARYRLPAMYFFTRSVLDGGLMSFGPDLPYGWRAAAAYVDKILRGERPADIPVVQPTRYKMLINKKTATSLGLTIPASILGQADEVIE